MRVGLEHFGQSVLLLVSMTFLRSPVLAIFAIMLALPHTDIAAHALDVLIGCHRQRQAESNHLELLERLSGADHGGNRMEKNCDRGFGISLHDRSYCKGFGAEPGPVDGV